jgi:signal transduction histidine kinase
LATASDHAPAPAPVGRFELLAMAVLVVATLVKTVAAHGPAAHLAVGLLYLGALGWTVRAEHLERSHRWLGIGLTTAAGVWSMAASRNETLLMTMALLPVTALWLGMRATVGVAAVLAAATTAISVAHGEPPRDTVQWVASVIGGDAFLLSVSRSMLRSRAAAEALRDQARQAEQLAAARERARIAADLHDGLGHHLSAALVQLEAARATAARDPASAARFVEQARGLVHGAVAELQRTVAQERPSLLANELRSALAELAEASAAVGVPVSAEGWEALDGGQAPPLAPEAAYALLRGVQEALTNVRRHAEARGAWIRVELGPTTLTLTVEDDGRGPGGMREGQGLGIMRARLEQLGGALCWGRGAAGGLALRLEVPR